MNDKNSDPGLSEGPQSALERRLIAEYLLSKGYLMKDLEGLPAEQAKKLMREASLYASLKLAELESKRKFREDIRSHS